MKLFGLITLIGVLCTVLFHAALDQAEAQPSPPFPPSRSTVVPPLPLSIRQSKSEQARLLREAAAIIEAEDRKQIVAFQSELEARMRSVSFDTSNAVVLIKNVSFMETGNDTVMQVTFEQRAK